MGQKVAACLRPRHGGVAFAPPAHLWRVSAASAAFRSVGLGFGFVNCQALTSSAAFCAGTVQEMVDQAAEAMIGFCPAAHHQHG